jgi:hypothetical protein
MNKDPDAALAELSPLGAGWIRGDAHWGDVEPRRGQFDFSALESLVKAARGRGMHVLATIRTGSPWADRPKPADAKHGASTPPKDYAEFGAFCRKLAEHFKGEGLVWQIENEPNSTDYWLGTAEEYGKLLKTGHDAIHEADAQATVLSAGLACGYFAYFGKPEKRYQRLKPWFDAIVGSHGIDGYDMHDYFPVDEGNPWGITFESYLRHNREELKAAGVNVPLWISETACPSGALEVQGKSVSYTPQQQATYVTTVVRQAREAGVAHLFWMFVTDTEAGQGDHLGLSTHDHQPKPAWRAYRKCSGAE